MPDTTYQYTFSDSLSNGAGSGAESGTISGNFTADYNTLLASGVVTVTTPEGTENFYITNANISKGAGDPNQFTFSGFSADRSQISLTYTSQSPTDFDFGTFQTSKANVASYSLVSPAPVSSTNTTACYCSGTKIATLQGDVAIETLNIGDVVDHRLWRATVYQMDRPSRLRQPLCQFEPGPAAYLPDGRCDR